MGTEAIWIPLVMAAVAGGTTYVNQRNTAKKQDSELARQIKAKGKKQGEADKQVNDLIQRTAGSDAKDEKGGILAQYLGQLNKAQPSAAGGIMTGAGGGTSQAYRDDAAKAAMGIEKFGANRADLLSTMDGAVLQRQGEALDRSGTNTELDMIKRRDEGDTATSNIRLQGIRQNPWLQAISAAASAYGGSYTGGAGGAATTGGTGYGQLAPSNGVSWNFGGP